jgi:glyoxylase-like metal-dependent hydrolase (beta-lactamase superfamily II)
MLLPVFPGVFLVDLPWVNGWLLARGDEAMLIDSGTARDRPVLVDKLENGLEAQGLSAPLRLHSLLLTHGHCDHAGNMAFLAESTGAKVYAHRDEWGYLALPNGRKQTYVPPGWRALSAKGLLFALGEWVWPVTRREPDYLVQEGSRIETPVGTLLVLHTPGHTPGHISFYHEREGWLFAGDALLNVVPWVRRNGISMAPPIFTSDWQQALQSGRRIAELGPSALLSGHGWAHTQNTAAAIRAYFAQRRD